MEVQPTKPAQEDYICNNCATRYVAPKRNEKAFKLVYENEKYFWVSENDEERRELIATCCQFPDLSELN